MVTTLFSVIIINNFYAVSKSSQHFVFLVICPFPHTNSKWGGWSTRESHPLPEPVILPSYRRITKAGWGVTM